MCDTPASKLRAARLKAGYASAAAAWEDNQRAWPFGLAAYRHYENGTRDISEEAAAVLSTTFADQELTFLDLYPKLANVAINADVPVTGEAKMGNYIDPSVLEGRTESLRGIPAKSGKEVRRALKIADESVNKYVGAGGFVIYRPLDPSDPGSLDQYEGELLFIEVSIGKLVERSVRIAKLQKDGRLKLSAYSTVGKYIHQRAAMYPCDEGNVRLLGLVIARHEEGGPSKLSTRK